MQFIHAEVSRLDCLSPNNWALRLTADLPEIRAGQYIRLKAYTGVQRFFSVASKPTHCGNGKTAFDLLVSGNASDGGTAELMAAIDEQKSAFIQGPFGSATLNPKKRNGLHVFVAFDSGYAYVRGLIDELLHTQPEVTAILFRFSRNLPCYEDRLFLDRLRKTNPSFTEYSAEGRTNWPSSLTQYLIDRLENHLATAELHGFYLGGGASRTTELASNLIAAGISPDRIFSDHPLK